MSKRMIFYKDKLLTVIETDERGNIYTGRGLIKKILSSTTYEILVPVEYCELYESTIEKIYKILDEEICED